MNSLQWLVDPAPVWLKLTTWLCLVLTSWLVFDRYARNLHWHCRTWLAGSLIGTFVVHLVPCFWDTSIGVAGLAGSTFLWWWLLWVPAGLSAVLLRSFTRHLLRPRPRKVVGCARHGTREPQVIERPSKPKRKYGPEEETIFLVTCFFGFPGAAIGGMSVCAIFFFCIDKLINALIGVWCAS